MNNKNKALISWSIVLLIIIVGGIFVYNNNFAGITSNSYLTSKEENRTFLEHVNQQYTENGASFDFSGFTGKWSLIEFESSKDNKIVLEDNTKIEKGQFYIVVLDSDYKNIAMHESKEGENLEFTTPKDGKYLVRIVGKNASGKFDIKISSENDISITHKDFWE
ncbi:hypothetical protein KQI86_05260 [Clostridium sp. MSJ-11]|uniref:Uncharacterized protein n=1 Tax=Clostridium mobile TaxID=2841512 RepID=A0ABS6EGY1_9CLOT|nr:hypothetical protein [Clostridium mobile]MBU5483730.1 hypothetical protein [Clostridium mobile]